MKNCVCNTTFTLNGIYSGQVDCNQLIKEGTFKILLGDNRPEGTDLNADAVVKNEIIDEIVPVIKQTITILSGNLVGKEFIRSFDTKIWSEYIDKVDKQLEFYYTCKEPSDVEVGGIPIGFTAIEPISYKDLFDMLLHKYKAPEFTLFKVNTFDVLVVNSNIPRNVSFSFALSNINNVKDYTICIKDEQTGQYIYENGSRLVTTVNVIIPETLVEYGSSYKFTISAKNSLNIEFNETLEVPIQTDSLKQIFWGLGRGLGIDFNDNTTPISGLHDLIELRSRQSYALAGLYEFPSTTDDENAAQWLLWPQELGLLTERRVTLQDFSFKFYDQVFSLTINEIPYYAVCSENATYGGNTLLIED